MTKAPAPDSNLRKPPTRPEFERQPVDASGIGAVEKPISSVERLFNNDAFRRALILVVLALAWEAYARWLNNPLLFPTFIDTVATFWSDLVGGELLNRITTSIYVLLIGYAVGLAISFVLSRAFVFRSREAVGRSGPRYVLAVAGCFALNQLVMAAARAMLPAVAWGHAASQLAGMASYTAALFALSYLWVFRDRDA